MHKSYFLDGLTQYRHSIGKQFNKASSHTGPTPSNIAIILQSQHSLGCRFNQVRYPDELATKNLHNVAEDFSRSEGRRGHNDVRDPQHKYTSPNLKSTDFASRLLLSPLAVDPKFVILLLATLSLPLVNGEPRRNTHEFQIDGLIYKNTRLSGADVHNMVIDTKKFELQIVASNDGSLARPCEVLSRYKAIAAINGGFFAHVVALGNTIPAPERIKARGDGNLIINGAIISISKDSLPTFAWGKSDIGGTITRIADFGNKTDSLPFEFALNGKPVLLQNGKRVSPDSGALKAVDGSTKKPRSGLCIGNDQKFRLFATLKANIEDWTKIAQDLGCRDAINLDGGSSTSLNLKQSLLHSSCNEEKPVHNTIIVVPKKT